MDNLSYKVGRYCRGYRINIIKKTLSEMEGANVKTLSGFENGRSTNLNHLETYMNNCETFEIKKQFVSGLIDLIEKDVKNR